MNSDLSKSKSNNEVYYEASNIEVLTNEAFGSVTNVKGNSLVATIPAIASNPVPSKTHLNSLPYPLGTPVILGDTTINEDTYLLVKHPANFTESKFFFAQTQSSSEDLPGPYIDSNLRVIVNNAVIGEYFTTTLGAVEGPDLTVGANVRFTAFNFSTEPNQPAPDPTLYLDVYENGVLINRQAVSLGDYSVTTTIHYDFVAQANRIYFCHAYTLPQPGTIANPFLGIDIFDYVIDGDPFSIYKMDKDKNVTLKFFDTIQIADKKIDVKSFYESDTIQKLYWANGEDELRFANVADPNLLLMNRKFLSTVPNVNISTPKVTGFSLGASSHTAGSIQYAYNLYKTNGAQSKVSGLSEVVYLNNGNRGNDINVKVDKSPIVLIENIDTSFDRIRIYSIKYNSLNAEPEIKLINEQNVKSTIEIVDDNNSFINNVTLSEFLFLGGDVYYPKHLEIKDNHLFLLNYKTNNFDFEFDTRAYRYDVNGNTVIKSKDGLTTYNFTKDTIPFIPETFDAINPTNKANEESADWNKYIWRSITVNGGVVGVPQGVTFNELFQVDDKITSFTELGYDSGDNPVDLDLVVPDYTTTSFSILNTFTPLFGLDVVSTRIVQTNSADYFKPGCADTLPNYNGASQWIVSNVGNVITLRTIKNQDSRCADAFDDVVTGEIVLTDGVNNYTVTFNLVMHGDYVELFPIEDVVITNFDASEVEGDYEAVLGGEGPNVAFSIKYDTVASNIGQPTMLSSPSLASEQVTREMKSLKSGEVYRLFIEFILEKGQSSFVKWVADVKIPEIGTIESLPPVDGAGNINYCYIETELKNIPNVSGIIGWRTCIVERTEFDKTVVSQGIYNPVIANNLEDVTVYTPSYFQRTIRNSVDFPVGTEEFNKPQRFNTLSTEELNLSNNFNSANSTRGEITSKRLEHTIAPMHGTFHSPEVVLNKSNLGLNAARIRQLGLIRNTNSISYRRVFNENGVIDDTLSVNNSVQTGADLLTNILQADANDRTKVSKFIADNKQVDNDVVFSRRQHAFTRIFGGYDYTRTKFNFENNVEVNNKVFYLPPILNRFNLYNPDSLSNIVFSNQINVPIQYQDDVFTGTIFEAYNGSCLAILGNSVFTIMSDDSLLPNDNMNDYGVMCELYRNVENQYGGDTYEARQNNRTIPYSNIRPLVATTLTTEHYGDTFIQKFNYLNTFKSNDGVITSVELVSFPVETSINLDLRWDITNSRPDNYDADELTSYGFNLAYNQMNNTVKGITKPVQFTEINNFPVNVLPSKKKFNGELIDSFTDFLVNDVKQLDGKFGEITGSAEYRDNVFAFQRNAVAYLAINPRVQVQATDGIPIELGSGNLIERYQYVTTNSGSLNKWGIVKSKNGIMFFDMLNKAINFLGQDSGDYEVTTVNGVYNKIKTLVDTHNTDYIIDNPVVNKGVLAKYDNLDENVYYTFLSDTGSLTVSYNGLAQGFISYLSFEPRGYITVNGELITYKTNTLWKHKVGPYNTFYGVYYPSYITLLHNENPDFNKIIDNLHFNSEFYVNNADVPKVTMNQFRVWNEYQDTGDFTFDFTAYTSSLKRRLRKWNLMVKRNQGTIHRIQNPWNYIKIGFDKRLLENDTLDYKFVLHDLLVSYTGKP